MDFEKLQALIQKATENFELQKKANDTLTVEFNGLVKKYDDLKGAFDKLKEGGDADQHKKMATQLEDLVNEMSDIRSKYRAPAAAITDEDQKKAIRHVVMKSFGAYIKDSKGQKGDVMAGIKERLTWKSKH